ncbi:MAG: AAA family ATPase [Treponema sp.]|nr:AAA family ATPase [Treponema sp.]
MKRTIYNELLVWKSSSQRKPLILYGARQVGKTWLLKEFANNEYKDSIYINYEKTNC